MEVYRVTKIEAGAPPETVVSPVPRPNSGNDWGIPGAIANEGKGKAYGPIAGTKKPAVELPENAKIVPGSAVPTYAKIRLDPHSHLLSIEIFNAQTNEVIRQIPPEEIARLVQDSAGQKGILVEKNQ